MENIFVSGAITVQFAHGPDRDSGATLELFQVRGLDSAGDEYVYDKAAITRNHHRIILADETDAVLSALKVFDTDTVHGSRDTFVWYDETGAAHTVRLIGGVQHEPIGPARNRIEISLAEDLAWSAPPAPASFAAAMASKTAAPVWILKLTVNSVAYYLSDTACTLTGWGGQDITTLPWVKSWGELRESVTGDLNEIKIADFSCSCLIDPAASPNLEELATAYPLEKSPACLYLWFHGLDPADDPPELKMRGYVRDVDIPDDTTLALVIEDEASRLYGYFGRRLDLADFPLADPASVGAFLPHIYGSVTIEALPIEPAVITTLETDMDDSQALLFVTSTWRIAVDDILRIDYEWVKVTGVYGPAITGLRGQQGSSAAAHAAGATVLNSFWYRQVYLVADHPVDSYGRIQYQLDDGSWFALSASASITAYTGQAGDEHPDYPGKAVIKLNLTTTRKLRVEVTRNITAPLDVVSDILDAAGFPAAVQVGDFPAGPPESVGAELIANGDFATDTAWTKTSGWSISGGKAVATATNPQYSIYQNLSITAGHLYEIIYTISLITAGSFRAFVGGGYGINRAHPGTYTERIVAGTSAMVGITGGSSVNTGTIDNVSVKEITPADLDYKFDGVISEYRRYIDWLDYLSFQCRAYFRMVCGEARLIVRPAALDPVRAIAACRIDDGGVRVHSRAKAPATKVINTIKLRFDRDWGQSAGDTAYRGVSAGADAGSIADHGVREQPSLFEFDFITSQAMADDVRGFYLARYATRRWLHTFENYLDQSDLKFGDAVTLGFAGNVVGEIQEVGLSPGDQGTIDVVKLVVEV